MLFSYFVVVQTVRYDEDVKEVNIDISEINSEHSEPIEQVKRNA